MILFLRRKRRRMNHPQTNNVHWTEKRVSATLAPNICRRRNRFYNGVYIQNWPAQHEILRYLNCTFTFSIIYQPVNYSTQCKPCCTCFFRNVSPAAHSALANCPHKLQWNQYHSQEPKGKKTKSETHPKKDYSNRSSLSLLPSRNFCWNIIWAWKNRKKTNQSWLNRIVNSELGFASRATNGNRVKCTPIIVIILSLF